MKLVAMTCPECKANIDVDVTGNRNFAFCQYCGSKILIDDGTKHIKFSYEDVAKVRKIEADQEEKAHQYQQEEQEATMPFIKWIRKTVRKNIGIIAPSAILFLMAFLPLLALIPQKNEHDKQVKHLEELVIEIQADIDAKEYDRALTKANSLRLPDSYSSSDAEKWDEQREDLINHINVLIAREQGKLRPPMSSSAAKSQNVDDVVNRFKGNGFTNVKTEEIKDIIAGWLKSEGDVEEVKINGSSGFSSNDYYDPDAEVVVRYHTSV